MYTPHFLHPFISVDGNSDCFHHLAIMNKAAMNMAVQIRAYCLTAVNSTSEMIPA